MLKKKKKSNESVSIQSYVFQHNYRAVFVKTFMEY